VTPSPASKRTEVIKPFKLKDNFNIREINFKKKKNSNSKRFKYKTNLINKIKSKVFELLIFFITSANNDNKA
jgi:hypothetical protein